jgi:hypothetical protein
VVDHVLPRKLKLDGKPSKPHHLADC